MIPTATAQARLSQNGPQALLVDRIVDAIFLNFAYPGAAVEQIAQVRYRSVSRSEMLDKIIEAHPYFVRSVIPAGVPGCGLRRVRWAAQRHRGPSFHARRFGV